MTPRNTVRVVPKQRPRFWRVCVGLSGLFEGVGTRGTALRRFPRTRQRAPGPSPVCSPVRVTVPVLQPSSPYPLIRVSSHALRQPSNHGSLHLGCPSFDFLVPSRPEWGLDLRFRLAVGPLLSTRSSRIGLLPFQTPLLALRSGVWIKDRLTVGPFVSIGCTSFRLLVPNMPSHVPTRTEIRGLVYGLRLAVNPASFLGYSAMRMREFICPHGFVMFQTPFLALRSGGAGGWIKDLPQQAYSRSRSLFSRRDRRFKFRVF